MRKGFNGLFGLVRDRLQCEPLSGHVFLFCNGQRNRLDASAGFDDREDGGDFGSGLLTADVDPVFATERHRAHGVFG